MREGGIRYILSFRPQRHSGIVWPAMYERAAHARQTMLNVRQLISNNASYPAHL
ncbi:MAG: hypothetical protein QOC96_601 [Acidobacteriota bacterium]|nr:hypothetical protein [Acidobacteriota bacterium]